MILSESDARERWCPFARPVIGSTVYAAPEGRAVDVGDDGCPTSIGQNCIGSRCMMWSWRDAEEAEPRLGFCGLIGAGFYP